MPTFTNGKPPTPWEITNRLPQGHYYDPKEHLKPVVSAPPPPKAKPKQEPSRG